MTHARAARLRRRRFQDWDTFERKTNLDHHCRITRHRMRLGSPEMVARREATLPAPPAQRYPPDAGGFFHLPALRTDSLWAQELGGRHIDFLKIDIDVSWKAMGMERLLEQRCADLGLAPSTRRAPDPATHAFRPLPSVGRQRREPDPHGGRPLVAHGGEVGRHAPGASGPSCPAAAQHVATGERRLAVF